MKMQWLSRCAPLSLLLLAACGGSTDGGSTGASSFGNEVASGDGPLATTHEPIVGGLTDRDDSAVLAIALVTNQEQALCSGSLIAPNLVLTARHCVAEIASPRVVCDESRFGDVYPPDELWVSDATSVGSGNFYPAREIVVPSNDRQLCGSDVALLILDGQFSSDAVPPVAPRLDAPVQPGEAFRAVGFGEAVSGAGAGLRRERSGLEVLCSASGCGDPDFVSEREFVGQQGICDGDSGGPAFDDQGRVVGVASRAGNDCDLAIYSAVAPWKDWVLEVAARAHRAGTYPQPAWELDAALDSAAATSSPDAGVTTAPDAAAPEPGAGAAPPLATQTAAARHDSGCALGPAAADGSGWAASLIAMLGAVAWRRRGATGRCGTPADHS